MQEKTEDQTVDKILECLIKKFWRSSLEKMEEWHDKRSEFKNRDFYEEGYFLVTMKEIWIRRDELKVTEEEETTLWMLKIIKEMKNVETFEYHMLREVIKQGKGSNMVDRFEEKYKELKVEGKREKNN